MKHAKTVSVILILGIGVYLLAGVVGYFQSPQDSSTPITWGDSFSGVLWQFVFVVLSILIATILMFVGKTLKRLIAPRKNIVQSTGGMTQSSGIGV